MKGVKNMKPADSAARCPRLKAFSKKLWPSVGLSVISSLTLTLSRWEREQPLDTFVKRVQHSQKAVMVWLGRGEQFSLSQRERAGVRESMACPPRGYALT